MWNTRYLLLIITIDNEGNAYICIDGSHVVHTDGKGHLGLFLTMDCRVMINTLKKLSIVTTSSTETEVVANGKRFPKYT